MQARRGRDVRRRYKIVEKPSRWLTPVDEGTPFTFSGQKKWSQEDGGLREPQPSVLYTEI